MTKLENLTKNLEQANQKLEEALQLESTEIHKDATIQRFEFVFELTWKTIQAYLKNQGIDSFSPRDCLREGGKSNLLDNVEIWIEFLNNRNLIAHTYNQETADKVYNTAQKMPKEVNKILENIKS